MNKIVSWMVSALMIFGVISLCVSNGIVGEGGNGQTPLAVYTSVQDGYWNDSATWGGGGTPTISDDANIGHNVTIALPYEECHDLTITSGGQLNMTNNQLNVTGDWDSSAGIFNYGDSLVNITVSGTSQTISEASFNNLTIYSTTTSTISLVGDISVNELFDINPDYYSFIITLTLNTQNYNITCNELYLGGNGFINTGILKCNDSIIDVGSGGITLGFFADLDGDTSLIKCGGNFTAPDNFPNGFTIDNSTLQFTKNATYRAENVQAFNLVIDEGVTLIIDDMYNGSAYWNGILWVNGTLDTITDNKASPHIQLMSTGYWNSIPNSLYIGENGDLSKARIRFFGRESIDRAIPEATYYTLELLGDWHHSGHDKYHLTGDIEVVGKLYPTYYGQALEISEQFYTPDHSILFETNGYNITTTGLTTNAYGRQFHPYDQSNVTINCSNSNIDIGINGFELSRRTTFNAESSTISVEGRIYIRENSFNANESNVIMDGVMDQDVYSFNNDFYGFSIINTDGNITFYNNTNISYAVIIPNVVLELNDNMTIGILYCDQVTFRSTDLDIERYLFSPFGQRNITDTTFNSVILVPQITAGEVATPILISLIPILIILVIIRKFIIGIDDVTEGWMK